MRNTNLLLVSCCLGLLTFSGCARDQGMARDAKLLDGLPFVYRMTVQQGNILSEEMAKSVQTGMTREQVKYLLGTPLLSDFFHVDRWDYVYTIKRGHGDMEQRSLAIHFQDDLVSRIDTHDWHTPQDIPASAEREVLITVPDYQKRGSLLRRILRSGKEASATAVNVPVVKKTDKAATDGALAPVQ